MTDRPTLDEFRRVYYDRELDYWDIADTWGVPRWQVDEWRRAFGLPSRRHYGTYRHNHPEDDWQYPFVSRHHHYARIQPHLWDRRRLPPPGLTVLTPPRCVSAVPGSSGRNELFWCVR
jgi:hypothetical protein